MNSAPESWAMVDDTRNMTTISEVVVSLFGALKDNPTMWKEIGSPDSSTAAHRGSHSLRYIGLLRGGDVDLGPFQTHVGDSKDLPGGFLRVSSEQRPQGRQPVGVGLVQRSEMYWL